MLSPAHFDAGEFVQSWDDDAARKVTACTKWAAKGLPPITPVPPTLERWRFLPDPVRSRLPGLWENGFWDRGSFYSRVVDIPQRVLIPPPTPSV